MLPILALLGYLQKSQAQLPKVPPAEVLALPLMAHEPKTRGGFTCADMAVSANKCIEWGQAKTVALFKWRVNVLDFDQERVRDRTGWLCRILFTSKTDAPLRQPKFGALSVPWRTMPLSSWPEFPLAQQNGIFFALSEGYFMGGYPEPLAEYVDYCVANGEFRTKPLRVPNQAEAQAACDELRMSDRWKAIKWKFYEPKGERYEIPEDVFAGFLQMQIPKG